MTPTTTYKIPKVKKRATNLPYFGLQTTSFLIPFPYFKASDVVVSLHTADNQDTLLVENTNYVIDGSVLRLNEESLGLNEGSDQEVLINASRNTQLDLAVYVAGHPVKAGDLNHNFDQLVYRIEENNILILNNTFVGNDAPVNPYKGQTWLRTPYYVHYIFDGSVWVQPT